MMTPWSLIAQDSDQIVRLEPAGMMVMGLSVLIVCGLTAFCVSRLLRERKPGEHHHAPLDIDTHDIER